MKLRGKIIDLDGNEYEITSAEVKHSWSVGIGRDSEGNLEVTENGEPVGDLRAVELYAGIGGAIGWSIMDVVDPT